jgi:uncharacterized protein (TIGR02466 family)
MAVRLLFATPLYEAELADDALLAELRQACRMLAEEDKAGRHWCRDNHYPGYTSYASLSDLVTRDPAFAALSKALHPHVRAFADAAHLSLGGSKPRLDSLWVNVLRPGGGHSGHIHPASRISGTLYVDVPQGASPLKLEDPRLPLMMAAGPKRDDAPEAARSFVYLAPRPGTLYLWESWLRHEVPPSRAKSNRTSISFNFR